MISNEIFNPTFVISSICLCPVEFFISELYHLYTKMFVENQHFFCRPLLSLHSNFFLVVPYYLSLPGDVKCFINHFAPSACDQTRIYWFLSNNWCMVQYGGETNCPVHMELNFCQTAFWLSSDSGCLKKTHFFVTSSVFINFQRWATTKICSFEKY